MQIQAQASSDGSIKSMLATSTLIIGTLFFLSISNRICAQCTGEAEWQHASTNRMRCGWTGYLTNDTYYFMEEVKTWDSFTIYGGDSGLYYTYDWYTNGGGKALPSCDATLCA